VFFSRNIQIDSLKYARDIKNKEPLFLLKIRFELINSLVGKEFLRKKNLPEKILSQIIFSNCVNQDFNKKMIYSYSTGKKLSHPLPIEWINIINKKVKVNKINSLCLYYIYGFKKITISLLKNFKIIFSLKEKNLKKKIAVFYSLNDNISYHYSSKHFNFFKKFQKFIDFKNFSLLLDTKKRTDLNKLNLDIHFDKNKIFINNNIFTKIKCLVFLLYFFLKSLFLSLFKDNGYFFIFDDLIKNFFIKNNNNDLVIFFNQQDILHRPLWTYGNSKIKNYIYFYSTNFLNNISNDELKNKTDYYNNFSKLCTWDNYISNCNEQKKILSKFLDKYNYKIFVNGLLPFEGKKFEILSKKKQLNYVSLFDIAPRKKRVTAFYENPCDYMNYNTSFYFYKQLIDYFSKQKNWKILVKPKRINKNKYSNIIENHHMVNVEFLDSSYSAMSVVNNSDLVISLPFSTPTMIAKEFGIPSFFYDPTNKISKNNIINEDVPLLSTASQIDQFLIKYKIGIKL
jgi:polysaccharide biosynthesis PFTS motif protein